MKINQFSQIGKRSNNEDSLGTNGSLLTVCDGMGGHNYGERASAFVVEAMLKAFDSPQSIGKMEIQQELNKVQTDLNQLLETEPDLEKMGTTFTGVFRTPDVWYAAHIGDSRIYLFRPSEQKLWHTWDHSLVGELMRTKEITVEAGRFHPMSNRISKAIIAQKGGKHATASIVKIDELKPGDVFMLCSDGVVEGWGDWELVQLFSDETLSFEQKCKKLAAQCNAKSKDNNTAVIAEIEDGDAFSFGSNDELEWTTFAEVEADYQKYVKDNEEEVEVIPQPEASNPEASSSPQSKEETPKQIPPKTKAPQSHPVSTPRQSQRPTSHSGNSAKNPNGKLFALLAALLVIVGVGILMLTKGRKSETPDPDTQAYEACKNVGDYRAYLSKYGHEALHYTDAKAYIDRFVNDSIRDAKAKQSDENAKKAQTELDRREREAYQACSTIGACENYLAKYPNGKYVKEVETKKANLERQVKEEAEQKAKADAEAEALALAEAEKKEEAAYKKCTTLAGCNSYLKTYPQGKYVEQVKQKKAELEAEELQEAGKKEDEAYAKCTTVEQCNNYLKAYPQGRYVNQVRNKKDELERQAKSNENTGKTPDEPQKIKGEDNSEKAPKTEGGSSKIPEISPEQNQLLNGATHQKIPEQGKNDSPKADTVSTPKKD